MNGKGIAVGALLGLVCMASGCMSVNLGRAPRGGVNKDIAVSLHGCVMDFSGVSMPGQGGNAESSFISALGSRTKLSVNEPVAAGFQLSSLKVESSVRVGTAGPVVWSIVTTALPCLSFKHNSCIGEVKVTYAIADATGKAGENREVRRRIKGGFSGWSFVRFAFRNGVVSRMQKAIPTVAADMLVKDICDSHGLSKRPGVRTKVSEPNVVNSEPNVVNKESESERLSDPATE